MTIELRVPISPTPSFLNRVILLAKSVRRFYPDTIMRAYVGQEGGATSEAIRLVDSTFQGHKIGWEWIGQREFDGWQGTRSPYLATMNRRFHKATDGDFIIIADADVICTAPFPELLETNAVQGVQAHVTPFGEADWRYLFAIFSAPVPNFDYAFSGNGIMGPMGLVGPWYANSGMIAAPRHLFEELCRPYHESISMMRNVLQDTYWADQLAVALAVAKSGVPVKTLPLRFNFPNQKEFDQVHPEELADARFVHYLRTDTVNRDEEFESEEAIQRFIARDDLRGSNELLRRTVEIVHGG